MRIVPFSPVQQFSQDERSSTCVSDLRLGSFALIVTGYFIVLLGDFIWLFILYSCGVSVIASDCRQINSWRKLNDN